jgi:hypothetical protein
MSNNLEICTVGAMPAAGGTAGGRQRAARRRLMRPLITAAVTPKQVTTAI